jgi:glycosyltransferase involved in cell wall biosynthesis
MRILHVNTFDAMGGAAEVARGLCKAYGARGHLAWLAVGYKCTNDQHVLAFPNAERRGQWARFWWNVHAQLQLEPLSGRWQSSLLPMLRAAARGLAEPGRAFDHYRGAEDFHFPATQQLLMLTPQPPDVVHGHNLHGGYFDLRWLPVLSHQLPLVLTLHDAWLLSGHCAHSLECERWKRGCGHCPDLTLPPAVQRDATAYNWKRKRDLYARSRLFIATPSRWLMRKVEQSILAEAVVEARVVPNGVDLSVFHPDERSAARRELAIPPEAAVLLFAGQSLRRNVWKDYAIVRDACALAAQELNGRKLLLIGLGDEGPSEHMGPAEVRSIPYEHNRAVVARYFQAADAYVHAARVDTFPQTVLEAMACGTPVIATAVGGIPEQIEHGRTGFLVEPGDAPGLASHITRLLTDDCLRSRLACAAVDMARTCFDFRQQVDAYLDWYDELRQNQPAATAVAPSRV